MHRPENVLKEILDPTEDGWTLDLLISRLINQSIFSQEQLFISNPGMPEKGDSTFPCFAKDPARYGARYQMFYSVATPEKNAKSSWKS